VAAGTAARNAAFTILCRVGEGDRFENALEVAVDGLQETDRRLAHEIAAGVLRQRTALDRQLDRLLTADPQRLRPELRDLLRIGAYQLIHLDRVPHYAALSTTVDVAKTVGGQRAAGLVNAVLRRLAAATEAGEMAEPTSELAASYSHPSWLVERWLDRLGHENTEALLEHNNTRAPLTLQAARVSIDELRQLMASADVPFSEAPLGRGLTVRTSQINTLPGYDQGAFIVQDAAQAWLLESVSIHEDAIVWDCCAAPGGKAAVLSHRVRHVFASDVRPDRLGVLRDTVTRAASDVSLFLADAGVPPLQPGLIDVILIDAPCSATGTMARHPDARWRLSASHLERLVERQATILNGVASVVSRAGSLVYLTCSLEPEENERQVDRFLDRHPEYRRIQDDVFVFPPDWGTDGGYAAHMRRVA